MIVGSTYEMEAPHDPQVWSCAAMACTWPKCVFRAFCVCSEMRMKSYTLSDLARKTSAVRHDAARAPVAITERNKPRFVLIAIEDYQALAQRTEDPRRAYLLEGIPPEEAELFDQALDRIVAGADD
jgi:PHD/YefM family antitoxin component YafN of YafNO toxin-antitoxin module